MSRQIYLKCINCGKRRGYIPKQKGPKNIFFRCDACGYQIEIEAVKKALDKAIENIGFGMKNWVKIIGEVLAKLSPEGLEFLKK